MKYHELNARKQKTPKRVGRGIAAGQGKTAGRGTKGQNSRTGGRRRPGFEGGQTPLMLRLPKLRGFRSIRTKAKVVYTGQLDSLPGKKVDNVTLAESGLTSSAYVVVKLVVKGDVTKPKDVSLQSASEAAKEAVQKAGGSFTNVPRVGRLAKQKASNSK